MSSEATLSKPKTKNVKFSEKEVLEKLFSKIGNPVDAIKISCVNVFSDFYRINIWHSINHPFLPNAGIISASYFFKCTEKESVILY
jgi:hypothetical protein